VPQTNLSLFRAGVCYTSIKIFNKLPKHIAYSLNNKKQFIRKLKNLLLDQSFYSVNEFLNYSHDLQQMIMHNRFYVTYIIVFIV
jgi:hypothetical protein